MKKLPIAVTLLVLLFTLCCASQSSLKNPKEFNFFKSLIDNLENDNTRNRAINYIDKHWKSEYEIIVLELFYFNFDNRYGLELLRLLEKHTHKKFGYDINKWYDYIWSKEERLIDDYHVFKAYLHQNIDFHFKQYFLKRQDNTLRSIRLDEIRWGGVKQDGIPPLRHPKMIAANDAKYLQNNHIVFGIEVNGDYRAYPKRILAWHEMFIDNVGGIPVVGVYCTLCGTVILYKTQHNGTHYNMGTSGFLYRSNKLMYDEKTQSLWNTLWGKPVVGPLVGKNIELEYLSVVTTTWGEWKTRHPKTKVLNIKTGFKRNYDEGIAYQDYFATDELMFNTPKLDRRLDNKQSVLAIRFPSLKENPLAISIQFLKNNPIYHNAIGNNHFVVFTDYTGANRVFYTKGKTFVNYDGKITTKDSMGTTWIINENELINKNGEILKRVHSFNAFWFGWQSAYPNTRLVK